MISGRQTLRQRSRGNRRFNGATARMPWRTAEATARTWKCFESVGSASMGPRHECRGEPRRLGGSEVELVIDRKGFNAATARMPWRTSSGRRSKHVTSKSLRPASMGPRHECRGERPGAGWSPDHRRAFHRGHGTNAVENPMPSAGRVRHLDASMRPRHECRG